MFNIFKNTTSNHHIPSAVVNKVIDNTPTYAGVKVSETTYIYFSNATEHFGNAAQAAANCGMYDTLTATHAAKQLCKVYLGFMLTKNSLVT